MALEALDPSASVAAAADPTSGNPVLSNMSDVIMRLRQNAGNVDPIAALLNQRAADSFSQPDLSGQVSDISSALQEHRAKYLQNMDNAYSPAAQKALDWQAIGRTGAAMAQPAVNGGNAGANGLAMMQASRDANQTTLDTARQDALTAHMTAGKEDYASILAQQALQKAEKDTAIKEAVDYSKSIKTAHGDPGELAKVMALRDNAKTPAEKAYIERLIQMKYGGEQGKLMANLQPQYIFGTPEYAEKAAFIRLKPEDRLKYIDAYIKDNTDAYVNTYGADARLHIESDAAAFVDGATGHDITAPTGKPAPSAQPVNSMLEDNITRAIAFRDTLPQGRDRNMMNAEILQMKEQLKAPMSNSEVPKLNNTPMQTSAQKAGATKLAEVSADDQAKAAALLPATETSVDYAQKLLLDILSDPDKELAVGKSSMFGLGYIPGGDVHSFGKKLGQVKGQAFLDAFANLRGGGSITEIEGKKATDAITRLGTDLSEADFEKAISELQYILTEGLKNQRIRARGQSVERAKTDQGAEIAAEIARRKELKKGK